MSNDKDIYLPHLNALSLTLKSLQEDDLLNENEQKSISALIAYAAYYRNTDGETIKALIKNQFNVDKIEELKNKDYDEAVRYLVNLKEASSMN